MMTRFYTIILIAMLSPIALLQAQTPAADAATAALGADADEESDKGPEHKLRDPFWPVGWTPPVKKPKTPQDTVTEDTGPADFVPKWSKVLRSIEVRSIVETFTEGEYIATVTGFGVVEKGNTLSIKHEGYLYKVLVKDISNKGIVPEKTSVSPLK